MVAVCCFSKYNIIRDLPDKSSASTTRVLQHMISDFGCMREVRVDGGTEFAGDFAALCDVHGVRRTISPPYHSRANGQVERVNRSIQSLLRRLLLGNRALATEHVPRILPSVELALNTTTHRSHGCPPYLIMFGTMPCSVAPSGSPPPPVLAADSSPDAVKAFSRHLEGRLRLLKEAARKTHEKYRASLPQTGSQPSTLALGGLAVLFRPRGNKLLVASTGPYLVIALNGSEVTL